MLQVTGNGKEWSIVNEETSIEVSFPSQSGKPLSFPLDQISCHLTDPWNKQVPCTITSTQPEVCTVVYTPTICGPHQLSIKIKNNNIQGSPFRVNVLPGTDSGVVQRPITEINCLRSVAVSKSGDVVVCHDWGKHISVFNRKGEKRLSFDSGGCDLVTFTADDNHILAVSSRQIIKYTMEGRHVISVECTNIEFHDPSSGIAVHPSGKLIIAGSCIQVLNPDLSHSHSFGVHSHGISADHVACDSDGVVYVAGSNCI